MSPPRENVQGRSRPGRPGSHQSAGPAGGNGCETIAGPPRAGQATMACSAARTFASSAATNQLIRTLKIGRGPKGLRPPFFQVVKTPGYFD